MFFIVLTKPLPGQSGLVPGEITDSAGLFSPKYSAQPCRKTGGSFIKVQDAEIPKYVQNTQICTNIYQHFQKWHLCETEPGNRRSLVPNPHISFPKPSEHNCIVNCIANRIQFSSFNAHSLSSFAIGAPCLL